MERSLGEDSSDRGRWTAVWTCNSDSLLNQWRFGNSCEVFLMGLKAFVIGAHVDRACCLRQLLEEFKILRENSLVLIFA